MNGLTIINIDVLPFMDLECMDPGSYFYKNMVLKASIPLALGLFATGAFSYLNRRSRAAHDEATSTRLADYKSAVIVFTLFMLNLLHPRWVAWPSLRDRPLPNVAVCTYDRYFPTDGLLLTPVSTGGLPVQHKHIHVPVVGLQLDLFG
jgi:hypothetical protein